MTIDVHRETATIIRFPLGPRRRLENGTTLPGSTHNVALTVIDSCWYHDEAVREPAPKPDRPKPY